MFTASSKYYSVGPSREDGTITLVDRKDKTKIYASKCKFFDVKSGIALIFKDGRWELTRSCARSHPNINMEQILNLIKVPVNVD